jgi:type I restriction enzyme S subunit
MKTPKGWQIITLDEVADVTGGIQKGPNRAPGANAVRYLTVAHVQRNRIITEDLRYFEVTAKELERWRLNAGDVLIIEGNGSASEIGRAALFRGEISDCVHQNHVIRIRAQTHGLSANFLNAFLNSSVGQATLKAESFSSSGLRTLSVGRIRELLVPLPPLPEQQKIADILCTWDEALEKLDALIAAKDRRKQALMQQLLTGKKRVQP